MCTSAGPVSILIYKLCYIETCPKCSYIAVDIANGNDAISRWKEGLDFSIAVGLHRQSFCNAQPITPCGCSRKLS